MYRTLRPNWWCYFGGSGDFRMWDLTGRSRLKSKHASESASPLCLQFLSATW